MTPHIKAKKGEIAKTVIMPGDPLRAKWIAENFLEDAKLVSDVRNMYCYTGKYNGKEVSVMGHGMGIPSIGIYTYELYYYYDVDTIIRVGSAGSYSADINVGDLILVSEAYSESNYPMLLGLENATSVIKAPTEKLNITILETANKLNQKIVFGRCHSSDVFYRKENWEAIKERSQSVVVEMEAFALFANALYLNKNAACVLTCSDSMVTGDSMPAEDRQTTFTNMIKLVLESI